MRVLIPAPGSDSPFANELSNVRQGGSGWIRNPGGAPPSISLHRPDDRTRRQALPVLRTGDLAHSTAPQYNPSTCRPNTSWGESLHLAKTVIEDVKHVLERLETAEHLAEDLNDLIKDHTKK